MKKSIAVFMLFCGVTVFVLWKMDRANFSPTTAAAKKFLLLCQNQQQLSPEAKYTLGILLNRIPRRDCSAASNYFGSVPTLWIENSNIVDLTPILALTNLKDLYLYGNKIQDLQGIQALENLQILDLSQNNIVSLAGLSQLKKLNQLDLSKNRIEDVSALNNLKYLQILDLSSNSIGQIPQLDLPHLNTLIAGNNPIKSETCQKSFKVGNRTWVWDENCTVHISRWVEK